MGRLGRDHYLNPVISWYVYSSSIKRLIRVGFGETMKGNKETRKTDINESSITEVSSIKPEEDRLTKEEQEGAPHKVEVRPVFPPREDSGEPFVAKETPISVPQFPALSYEPYLVSGSVTFHTFDNNKDAKTRVTMTVREIGGTIAARISNNFGEFNDNSENGPYNLVIINPSFKSQLRSGNVTVRIDPEGNDEWAFGFFLNLGFSDGTHLTCKAYRLRMFGEQGGNQAFGLA